MKQDKKDTELSAGLFLVASILNFILWTVSGFEEMIWCILGLLNMSTAIISWSTNQKNKQIPEGKERKE